MCVLHVVLLALTIHYTSGLYRYLRWFTLSEKSCPTEKLIGHLYILKYLGFVNEHVVFYLFATVMKYYEHIVICDVFWGKVFGYPWTTQIAVYILLIHVTTKLHFLAIEFTFN